MGRRSKFRESSTGRDLPPPKQTKSGPRRRNAPAGRVPIAPQPEPAPEPEQEPPQDPPIDESIDESTESKPDSTNEGSSRRKRKKKS